MASRKTVRAAAAQPSPVTTPQAQSTAAAIGPRVLALAVPLALAASLVVTAGWSSAAHAQAAEGQTRSAPAARADADDVRQYDIPAGPLSEVLTRFSTESGIFLGGATDLAEGKRSPGLQGQYSVEQALRTLLSGSGLSYRFAGENRVTLVAAQEGDGPLRTGPILVAGDAAGGAGPVEGFRAENSSSATNVDAPLIETPATVNVITRDFLNTTQPQQFSNQFDFVPGVSGNSNLFRGFNVRGFNTSPDAPETNGTSVLVGNFVAPARRYHFDQGLYERIDVLKGTSAVLFGPSQAGGVVRYVPKRPEFEWRHRLQGTLGNFDTERGVLDSTGPLTEDLAYRLIVIGQDNNQTTHGSNSDISFDERVVINPAITWLTPTGGELYLGYEYSDQTVSLDRGIARLPATGELLFNGKPLMTKDNVRTVETHVVTAELTQPISDNWGFFVGGRYNDNEVLRRDFVSEGEFGGDPNLSSFTNFFQLREMEFLDLRAEVDGRFSTGWLDHQITVGVNYRDFKEAQPLRNVTFQSDVIDPRNPIFPDVPRIGPAPFKRDVDTEIKQFFVQDYVSIGEKLKVFGGLTWTDAVVSVRTESGGAEGADEALDGSIGLIYNHSAWLNPFVSYATSLQPQTGTLLGGGVVPFSESDQIEIGLKSEWFDRRLRTTASVFEINKTNIAESAPPPNSDFAILAGDQRTRGFEFEAVGNVTDQFRITGGYSYFDAEFTESTTGNEGNTPFAVPKHKVSLFGEYVFTGELRGWRAGLGFIHVGDRQADNDNTVVMPGYERVDLTLAYERGPFDFHARVENLFDEDYIIGGSDFLSNRFEQGAPRLIKLTVGYEF